MTITANNLPAIIASHAKWLSSEDGGVRAILSDANLSGANLTDADLRRADLRRAGLSGAILRGANLADADFTNTNLAHANFSGAILNGTVLDQRRMPASATAALLEAGIPVHDGVAYGWRTRKSVHVGSTEYKPGRYVTPVFSVCHETECHPGLYFGSRRFLQAINFDDLIPVATWVSCVCAAGGKFRTKELWVFEEADDRWTA